MRRIRLGILGRGRIFRKVKELRRKKMTGWREGIKIGMRGE